MKRLDSTSTVPRFVSLLVFLLVVNVAFGPSTATVAWGQLPTSEERLKILTEPESIKKKMEKDKSRPPIEMFRSQVAPFDILPYMKANHWSSINLELRSNFDDYNGFLQSNPVPLLGMPQEILFRRDARLLKTQRARLGFQLMLPRIPKEISLEILHPDAIRPDDIWPASLRVLEPHQMLVLFLTKESNSAYAQWNRFNALYPLSTERDDLQAVERARYYRLVLPLEPDRPLVSAHPLTWTTISHVVWDGMAPDTLNPSQQQAMLDWLHWGGQLILVGGAGSSFSILKDSFLNPYLPAEVTGQNALLTRDDLQPLAEAFPPPIKARISNSDDESTPVPFQPETALGLPYRKPVPIKPAPNRPVFLTGLAPKPGAIGLPLGGSGEKLIGVERRVGRGRILMLAFNPTDPAFVTWPGLDTLVRRVVLRRPEETFSGHPMFRGMHPGARFGALSGPSLSWVRYFTRDLQGSLPRTAGPTPEAMLERRGGLALTGSSNTEDEDREMNEPQPPGTSVAEWVDSSAMPRLSRDALEAASGITIPDARFVLKVVLAYILALVPLNWLLCRYVFGRRELAWIIAPLLSIGFAVAVERAAAYDIGYNSACDEIDVIETYGEYPRALVSRFASLYSTGRTRYTIAFPNDPTALALPLDTGRSLRGEDIVTSVWQSYPTPALEGFLVQPRSLAMFRVEQMTSLDGAISLVSEGEGGTRKVVNEGSLEIRDAILVDLSGPKARKETYLGTISPGASVAVTEVARPSQSSTANDTAPFHSEEFLKPFRADFEDRPENRGEIRLVGWTPQRLAGPKVEPEVDRHRGFTAVVVHLKNGAPPSPDGPEYNAQARETEARTSTIGLSAARLATEDRGVRSLPGRRTRFTMSSAPATGSNHPSVPPPTKSETSPREERAYP